MGVKMTKLTIKQVRELLQNKGFKYSQKIRFQDLDSEHYIKTDEDNNVLSTAAIFIRPYRITYRIVEGREM